MRRPFLRLLPLCLVALAGLTGCPPTYPKCSSDENCKDHSEVCVQGQCQECATDANCKPGFVCSANKCVPKPECDSNTRCPGGKKCSSGKCVSDKPEGSCDTDADCPSGQGCKEGRCATREVATTDACSLSPIRFDFNESRVAPEAANALNALADCIKKNGWKMRLEGHADERGTEEYNLQLSNRRAASVKAYLVNLGVSDKSLETVGYGENRPAVDGHDEAAWAANRRVEFVKK
jgi:peptidoglycan-associated lipoprotein